jgi:hypothetical protein
MSRDFRKKMQKNEKKVHAACFGVKTSLYGTFEFGQKSGGQGNLYLQNAIIPLYYIHTQ